MQSVNPANGEVIETYTPASAAGLSKAVVQAKEASRKWGWLPLSKRCELLEVAANTLESRRAELARLMALEMGKPIDQGRSEIDKCAWVCRYYAENAEDFLADERVATGAADSRVVYRPLGTVLAVMPWNFPFWQVLRFAAPTLAAGNTVLLKHASNVPQCALEIASLFAESGFPEGVFQSLLTDAAGVKFLLSQDAVRAVSLTGSTGAGRAVAKMAGQNLKPAVLELGGSDPYVVLGDADIGSAAKACAQGRLMNSGQSCIAAKRFIVVDAAYDSFRDALVAEMESKRVGDPLSEADVGPLATRDMAETLDDQVRRSIAAGATRILGHDFDHDQAGAFFPISLLEDVGPGQPAFEEELFGPVGVLVRATGEREAIELANATDFGLGAAVFTRDLDRGRQIASDFLEAGCCFVNDFVKSDPRLPFGGIKDSGFGRELGRHGILAFTNTKTVYVS